MSIFGKLDAANIPTNAYFVEAGEYTAQITKAEIKVNKSDQRQLHIVYTIIDEDSSYKDSTVQQFLNLVDPDLTLEILATLPAEEQRSIRRNNSNLKKTLCGDGRYPGLGVDPDDLNDDNWSPEFLIGTEVDLSVTNWGSDGVNVRYANIIKTM